MQNAGKEDSLAHLQKLKEDDFMLCSATFLDYSCGSLKVIKMPLHELVEDSADCTSWTLKE